VGFDRPMLASVRALARLIGLVASFRCASAPGSEAVATVTAGNLAEGFHMVETNGGATSQGGLCSFSVFLSTLLVTALPTTFPHPKLLARPGFVCGGLSKLCHDAAGTNAFRGQHDGGAWSK